MIQDCHCQQFLDQVNKDETWMYGFNFETICNICHKLEQKSFVAKTKRHVKSNVEVMIFSC